MKPYLEELRWMFGEWPDFKQFIEKSHPDYNEDFEDLLNAVPPETIPDFLKWMLDIGNTELVKSNASSVMQLMANYNSPRKIWIGDTITILSDMHDDNVDQEIAQNLMGVIKGPYKLGNPFYIFNLCYACRDISNFREIVEENFTEILETIFSNNQYLSSHRDVILKIQELIARIADKEGVSKSDISHVGAGQYSECIQIGGKVLKFGKRRPLEELPPHKRILQPIFRGNIPMNNQSEIEAGNLKEEDVVSIECQDLVDTKWTEGLSQEEIEENLYKIYRELRHAGIIWTDIKAENVGRLLNANVVNYTVLDTKGNSVQTQATLPVGELVVFDTDRIYTKENLPQFNESGLDRTLYIKFEDRFNNEVVRLHE